MAEQKDVGLFLSFLAFLLPDQLFTHPTSERSVSRWGQESHKY